MAKTARIDIRVEPELKARLEAEADRLGQKVTTFIERALERALTDPKPYQAGFTPAPEGETGRMSRADMFRSRKT